MGERHQEDKDTDVEGVVASLDRTAVLELAVDIVCTSAVAAAVEIVVVVAAAAVVAVAEGRTQSQMLMAHTHQLLGRKAFLAVLRHPEVEPLQPSEQMMA